MKAGQIHKTGVYTSPPSTASSAAPIPVTVPSMSPERVKLQNEWYGRLEHFDIILNDHKFDITPIALSEMPQMGEILSFALRCPHGDIAFQLEEDFLFEILNMLPEPLDLTEINTNDRSILLEFVISSLLEKFEKLYETKFEIVSLTRSLEKPDNTPLAAAITINSEKRTFGLSLEIPEESIEFWRKILERRPTGPNEGSKIDDRVFVTLSLQIGAVEFTLKDVIDLDAGDVIVLDSQKNWGERREICIGARNSRHCLWPAMLVDDGARLTGPPVSQARALGSIGHKGNKQMSDLKNGSSIEDIPIVIAFEIGRKDLSVRDLKNLQEGTVIEFPGSEDGKIQIIANGREVGWGALVRVGEAFAVKVDQIFIDA